MHSHALSGGQFREDAVVEHNMVKSRRCMFVLVGERQGVLLVVDGGFSDERGDEHSLMVTSPR